LHYTGGPIAITNVLIRERQEVKENAGFEDGERGQKSKDEDGS
jgi:hypothetical protein